MANTKSKLSLALGSVFVASMAASSVASAAQNPFAMSSLDQGYMVAAADIEKNGKMKDGKCGEGKCGASKDTAKAKSTAVKSDDKAKIKEAKCGEGKCGGSMK